MRGFLSLTVLLGVVQMSAMAMAADGGVARLATETHMVSALMTYNVTLVPAQGSPFVSGSGTLTERATHSCKGWASEQRLYVRFMPPQQGVAPVQPVFLRSGSNSFESADGLTYAFEDKANLGGQMVVSHKGVAQLTAAGQAGKVTYADPASQTLELPAGTVFPSAFSSGLLTAAGDGQRRFSAVVFDGSMDPDKALLNMQAQIGTPRAAVFKSQGAQPVYQVTPDFNPALAWSVKVSGMQPASGAGQNADGVQQPVVQQTFSLLTNGRAETSVMDFGNFRLQLDLVKYEEFPDSGGCASAPQ